MKSAFEPAALGQVQEILWPLAEEHAAAESRHLPPEAGLRAEFAGRHMATFLELVAIRVQGLNQDPVAAARDVRTSHGRKPARMSTLGPSAA